ncbi:MAG: entericidin [Gammaproteobacteria bacterium]|nr:entericidin [Gammaproteobacteria bacterium]
MQKIILTFVLAMAVVTLASCETTRGFGKDLKILGEKIEGSPA